MKIFEIVEELKQAGDTSYGKVKFLGSNVGMKDVLYPIELGGDWFKIHWDDHGNPQTYDWTRCMPMAPWYDNGHMNCYTQGLPSRKAEAAWCDFEEEVIKWVDTHQLGGSQ